MTNRVEDLKQKMKEEYAKKIDEYFIEYEELKSSGELDINGIEKLLGNGITGAKKVLTETLEELIESEPNIEVAMLGKKRLSSLRRSTKAVG
jgi:hypothetical protein